MHEIDVAVIGGGAAGIAAAARLRGKRQSSLLIEARNRVGGRALTLPGDFALDLGCGWLHSADENEWAALAPQLGFQVDDYPPPWARPAWEGNFSAAEQTEYWAAWRRFYTRVEAAEDKDLLLSDCFEPGDRFNAQLGAVITYANGAEAEKMTTREYALYHDSGRNKRIERGYGTLIAAHAAGLDVQLDCPVSLIDHSGKLIRIVTPRGELSARAAIVATPPGVIANETLRFSPALPAKLTAAANLPLGVADKIFLRIEDPEDLPKDTRVVGSRLTRETGSYTLRAFGRPVIEGYFGGAFAASLEGEIAPFAIEQICSALGNGIAKRLSVIAESAWARDPYSLGSYSYAGVGAAAARATLAAPVDERLFFAGEHCSPHDFSTAHGAYRTGVTAAEDVMQALVMR
ncbi:MAG: NAD(P)/FAD-dependent oxidoreductase [Xanthobacteraceae bacterium]